MSTSTGGFDTLQIFASEFKEIVGRSVALWYVSRVALSMGGECRHFDSIFDVFL
jgi:hypothetical protein